MPDTLRDAVAGAMAKPDGRSVAAPVDRDPAMERLVELKLRDPREFERLGRVTAFEVARYQDGRRAAAAGFTWLPSYELMLGQRAAGVTFADLQEQWLDRYAADRANAEAVPGALGAARGRANAYSPSTKGANR